MDERDYYLGFSAFPGVGPGKFKLLLKRFGSAKTAWKSSFGDKQKAIGNKLAEQLEKFRQQFSIEQYAGQLRRKDVSFFILTDKEYPKLLKQIPNPAFVLYCRGQFEFNAKENEHTIGIVGSRKITSYGTEATKLITGQLVLAGFSVVSGLALGVDALAHKTTLENSGKTIAVLGCGVDCCFPSENQNLYNRIIETGGAVVSEFPLGMPPSKGSFPSRNRIISGLSLGIVVTEGAEDSGSLITADYAFKQNRKVFAVPGPITSGLSKGPFKLIAKGAKLVTSGSDIIQELGLVHQRDKGARGDRRARGDTKEEQRILDLLENEAMHFDEIARKLKMDSVKLGSLLSMMEIKGFIKSLDSGIYSIAS